jgi:[acyl-carrier-protein] S-malonyltransferase
VTAAIDRTTGREATDVVGFVDGRPIPGATLDRRLAVLRAGPRSAALPVPGSPEDRQLRRWVAQVILTEELCRAEASARGLRATPSTPVRIDQRAAVEMGSITAAAFEGSAAVRVVYEAVTAEVTVAADEVARYQAATAGEPAGPVWRVSVNGEEFDAAPDTLPARLATALGTAGSRHTVTVDGWTARLVAVAPHEDPAEDDPRLAAELLAAARRLAFVRWLEHARATRLRLVAGLEHPGDPGQPDNHHKH